MMNAPTTGNGAASAAPTTPDGAAIGLALSLVAARLQEHVRPAVAALEDRMDRDDWPDWAEPLGTLAYLAEAAAEVIHAAGCELRGVGASGATLTELERLLGDFDHDAPIGLTVTESGTRAIVERNE